MDVSMNYVCFRSTASGHSGRDNHPTWVRLANANGRSRQLILGVVLFGLVIILQAQVGQARALLQTQPALVTSGADVVKALANPLGPSELLLVNDYTTIAAADFSSYDLPIVVTRNITILGRPERWLNLNAGHIQRKVRLTDGVVFTLRYVVLSKFFDVANSGASAELLYPMAENETAILLLNHGAMQQELCFPADLASAYLVLNRRPASIPGDNQYMATAILQLNGSAPAGPATAGNDSDTSSGGGNSTCSDDFASTAVAPLAHCWNHAAYAVDYAISGRAPDETRKPVPTGYLIHVVDGYVLCEAVLDAACIATYSPVGCMNLRYTQQQQDTSSSSPANSTSSSPPPGPAVTLSGAEVSQVPAASGGQGSQRVAGVAAGASVAAAVALLLLVLVAVRVRRGRLHGAGHKQEAANGCGDGSSSLNAEGHRAMEAGHKGHRAGNQLKVGADASSGDGITSDDVTGGMQPVVLHVGEPRGVNVNGEAIDTQRRPPTSLAAEDTSAAGGLFGDDGVYGNSGDTVPCSCPDMPRQSSPPRVRELDGWRQQQRQLGVQRQNEKKRELDGKPRQPRRRQGGLQELDTAQGAELNQHPEQLKPHAVVSPLTPLRLDLQLNFDMAQAVTLLPVVRGKGAYGKVYEGLYGGERVAVKVLPRDLFTPEEGAGAAGGADADAGAGAGDGAGGAEAFVRNALWRSFAQEVEVLGRCRHPNVVRLLAACLTPPRMCLVMELMDTSLQRLVFGGGDKELMPLAKALHIGTEVARSLEYLHPTVVHRDLKPDNILLSDIDSPRPTVKVSDFGLSRLRSTVAPTRHPDAGTPAYMAPECFDVYIDHITHHVDVYSWGVVLWTLLTGVEPWAGCTVMEIAYRVSLRQQRLPAVNSVVPGRCPRRLQRLIDDCWDRDPERRPAAAEVVKRLLLVQQLLEDPSEWADTATTAAPGTRPPTTAAADFAASPPQPQDPGPTSAQRYAAAAPDTIAAAAAAVAAAAGSPALVAAGAGQAAVDHTAQAVGAPPTAPPAAPASAPSADGSWRLAVPDELVVVVSGASRADAGTGSNVAGNENAEVGDAHGM